MYSSPVAPGERRMRNSSRPTGCPPREMVKLPSSTVTTCAGRRAAPRAATPRAAAREAARVSGRRAMYGVVPRGRGSGSRSLFGGRGEEDAVADARPNALVQRLPLGRGGERGAADGAGASFGDAQPPPPVTAQRLARHHIILGELHAHEVRGE